MSHSSASHESALEPDAEILELSFFREAEEAFQLAESLSSSAKAADALIEILGKYQENGELLDPSLERLASSILSPVRTALRKLRTENLEVDSVVHRCSRVLHCLCQVRGERIVSRFVPHATSDVMPVITTLEALLTRANWTDVWHSVYTLLLWLSVLVLMPFDLASIGDNLLERIRTLATDRLGDHQATQRAASQTLTKLLMRPDMTQLLDTCLRELLEVSADAHMQKGRLLTLCALFRDLPHETWELRWLSVAALLKQLEWNKHKSASVRELSATLTQRLLLTQLSPHEAPWRYRRKLHNVAQSAKADEEQLDPPEEADFLIAQLLSALADEQTRVRWAAARGLARVVSRLSEDFALDLVHSVLQHLDDKCVETWHGSMLCLAEMLRRGLILIETLPIVLNIVLRGLFFEVRRGATSAGDNVRDAACFAAWALARTYEASDVLRLEAISKLPSALLALACFDREVHCRRAACAAFQEGVGRLGEKVFPHGIAVNTTADFFSVATTRKSFLQVSVQVARFPAYTTGLIEAVRHERKFGHWDRRIRLLSAEALGSLLRFEPRHVAQHVLPEFIRHALDRKALAFARHGAALGVARMLQALCGRFCSALTFDDAKRAQVRAEAVRPEHVHLLQQAHTLSHKHEWLSLLPVSAWNNVVQFAVRADEAQLFRGRGGFLLRESVCEIISSLAEAVDGGFANENQRAVFLRFAGKNLKAAMENLRQPHEQVRTAATEAVSRMLATLTKQPRFASLVNESVGHMCETLARTPFVSESRSIAAAFGALSLSLLERHRNAIFASLKTATQLKNSETDDAETRVNAVESIVKAAIALSGMRVALPVAKSDETSKALLEADEIDLDMLLDESDNEAEQTEEVAVIDLAFECIAACGVDYACDERGDIGRIVRMAAMRASARMLEHLCSGASAWLDSHAETVLSMLRLSTRQLLERNNETRRVAAESLISIAESLSRARVTDARIKQVCETVLEMRSLDSYACEEVFAFAPKLLLCEPIREAALYGLCFALGGLTESLRRSVTQCLTRFFDSLLDQEEQSVHQQVAAAILRVLKDSSDRTALQAAARLISEDGLRVLMHRDHSAADFASRVAKCVRLLLRGSGSARKLLAAAEVYKSLLSFLDGSSDERTQQARQEVLRGVLLLLGHPFPRVRAACAEHLFELLLLHDTVLGDVDTEAVSEVLSTGNWREGNVQQARRDRDSLFSLLGVPAPQVKRRQTSKTTRTANHKQQQQPSDYADFVRRMHPTAH